MNSAHAEEKENPEFAIRNRKEIAAILDDLVKSHTAINLDAQDGMSLVTSILKVSNEGNYVYLDISQDNKINDQIIHSKLRRQLPMRSATLMLAGFCGQWFEFMPGTGDFHLLFKHGDTHTHDNYAVLNGNWNYALCSFNIAASSLPSTMSGATSCARRMACSINSASSRRGAFST